MTKKTYLETVFQYLGVDKSALEISSTKEDRGEAFKIIVPEDKVGFFIGSKGETLESIELLFNITFREKDTNERIILDINDYRKQKEDRLKQKAVVIAQRVLQTGQEYVFRSLNSFERYIVHSEIANNSDLSNIQTKSEDDGDERILVISQRTQTTK